ncbi:glycosyltransferase, partial [Staphylococcus aureus]|uniref:glycosyltransferase n=1 Tax=Staphylococcus aureus TaxID=1280 RepID=UPI0023AEB751
NSSWPSRKGFPEAFLAFKQFKRDHPDAVLYLHTAVLPVTDGFNLQECAELSGLTNEDILIANQADYAMGFPDSFVASIYRASDVLLAPSMGEGFGLPLVEAQACGCPVITLNFSAMPEIIFNGILTEPLQPFYVPTGAWQAVPDIKALFNALEQVYNWTPEYRQQQAEIGVNQVEANYSLTAVAPLWDALMKRIPARAHEHEWATTGIVEQNGNRISLPCLAGRCAAANLVYRDGRSEIVENVYPLTIDGIDIEVDDPDGISRLVCREAVNVYNLDKVELNPEG